MLNLERKNIFENYRDEICIKFNVNFYLIFRMFFFWEKIDLIFYKNRLLIFKVKKIFDLLFIDLELILIL